MAKTEKAFCGRMDHGGCGLLVHVEDGRIVKIEGDPDSHTKGYICPKGRAHIERLYHPDRLKYPQKRIGGKGENRWKRISWDEALEITVQKLLDCRNRSAPESALFMQGTPKGLENPLLYRFARSFGSPNVTATGAVCFAPRLGASLITTGYYPHPDLGHPPESIVVWGSNHLSTSADGVLAPELAGALKKKSAVILIDPVKRDIAKRSDVYLQIKPGSDGLLALGMIKVIIEEGLYDKDFVGKWTSGFEELRSYIAMCSLGDIEKKTAISTEHIKKAARLYSRAESACILWGNAIDHDINSVQTARALLILMGLTGNLDRPGGNINAVSPKVVRPGDFMLGEKFGSIKDKMIGKDFKLAAMLGFVPLPKAIKCILDEDPYKINFAYIQCTNPLMNYPNCQDTLKALKKVDFLVVAEIFMTPTAQMADIVLPVASHFEFDDLGFYGLPFGKILVRPKIITPPGECRSDVKIINELAIRMKLEDPFWENEEQCIDYILKPSGLKFQDAKKRGMIEGSKEYERFIEKGFRTKSGKVEFFSSWMRKNGYAALPTFLEREDTHNKEMNLIFTSAKIPGYFHSMNRNLPSLRKLHPEPRIMIHPTTAKEFNIDEEDWVWVENDQGRAKFRAKPSLDIHPGVVIGEHGWWFPEKEAVGIYGWDESNINALTKNDPPYEPSIGGVNLRGFPCRLYNA